MEFDTGCCQGCVRSGDLFSLVASWTILLLAFNLPGLVATHSMIAGSISSSQPCVRFRFFFSQLIAL